MSEFENVLSAVAGIGYKLDTKKISEISKVLLPLKGGIRFSSLLHVEVERGFILFLIALPPTLRAGGELFIWNGLPDFWHGEREGFSCAAAVARSAGSYHAWLERE